MWKWVSENRWRYDSVTAAKARWLEINGYGGNESELRLDCFFCQYFQDHRHMKLVENSNCPHCPAAMVDAGFDCLHYEYGFDTNPKAFYAKLVELNKKRLAK
jgi:hypothetical protein